MGLRAATSSAHPALHGLRSARSERASLLLDREDERRRSGAHVRVAHELQCRRDALVPVVVGLEVAAHPGRHAHTSALALGDGRHLLGQVDQPGDEVGCDPLWLATGEASRDAQGEQMRWTEAGCGQASGSASAAPRVSPSWPCGAPLW